MLRLFTVKQFNTSKKSVYSCGKKIFSYKPFIYSFDTVRGAPKFCVSYSVFDGEELLEASIKSIRSEVDYVNVVYQTLSWRGNPCNEGFEKLLLELKEKKLIDELILFEPDLKQSPQVNETAKRNIGLKAALKAGGNYFMAMDVDEFYRTDDLKNAKTEILNRRITHSYCQQIIYGDRPTLMKSKNYGGSYVQFFSRIDERSILGSNENSICLVDPTRMMLDRKGSKHFVLHNVAMHHMSKIRKDIRKKYENSSSDNFSFKVPIITTNCVEVENYFSIEF